MLHSVTGGFFSVFCFLLKFSDAMAESSSEIFVISRHRSW